MMIFSGKRVDGLLALACAEEGSSLVELALLLPVLLLFLVVAVDFGRAYSASMVVNSSASAGALYGVQNPGDVAGMVLAAKLDVNSVLALTPTASFGCECADGSGAVASCLKAPTCSSNIVNYVEVDISTSYTPLLPYPGFPTSIPVNASARMRVAQ